MNRNNTPPRETEDPIETEEALQTSSNISRIIDEEQQNIETLPHIQLDGLGRVLPQPNAGNRPEKTKIIKKYVNEQLYEYIFDLTRHLFYFLNIFNYIFFTNKIIILISVFSLIEIIFMITMLFYILGFKAHSNNLPIWE